MLGVPLPVILGASRLTLITRAVLRAVPAGAVFHFHFRDGFLKMMWPAQQLALVQLLHHQVPRHAGLGRNGETFSRGVNVIKLKIISRSAPNAYTT